MYYFMDGDKLAITPVYNIVTRRARMNYVVRSPENVFTHFKNGSIHHRDELGIMDPEELRIQSSILARKMLNDTLRKKKSIKPKSKRIKKKKDCGCK
jgi:hypothetical protein